MDEAEDGQQNKGDEAASRQHNLSIEQLQQQFLAQQQQLKDAEERSVMPMVLRQVNTDWEKFGT